jgi:hypothetical protein
VRLVRKEHQLALRFDMRALVALKIRHPSDFIRRKSDQRLYTHPPRKARRFDRDAACTAARNSTAARHRDALAAHGEQLQIWEEIGQEGYEMRAALAGAEVARIKGRAVDADHLHEAAIRAVGENRIVDDEARRRLRCCCRRRSFTMFCTLGKVSFSMMPRPMVPARYRPSHPSAPNAVPFSACP